ncbi:GP-PDE domain-containing protein [Mycena kentingensis (nom. inval.)]|nr:GP-PDE domain-containing protein [Mycena kentingensis (nom. inval.)]
MSSWTSWIPSLSLPSLPLPSAIQRRFISFVLRRFLGHLLKPGQLDVEQIDSQIGNGYVQVNELQLDSEAINATLAGLPLELDDGSISRVTARIPWPNPLTSTIGLSVDGLHLILLVVPPKDALVASNLADSVVSVADSFIHDELTPREEATLRESFHPDLVASISELPGGLDPFIAAPEEQEAFRSDDDPAGVGIFATLIERLLARFEFNATDISITLVHPGHAQFTIHIPRIEYCTEMRTDDATTTGETRSVTISGLSVSIGSLQQPPQLTTDAPFVSEPSPIAKTKRSPTPEPPSPASSSSSLDDTAQYAMSQSLAFLPQRPASPASSVASSMYQSAISEAEANSPDDRTASLPSIASALPERSLRSSAPEVVLSFSTEPLKISLATPDQREPSLPVSRGPTPEVMRLSVEVGTIGCALRAWHIQELLEVSEALANALPPSKPTTPTPNSGSTMDLQVQLRGVALLLLPPLRGEGESEALAEFFSRPLVPPRSAQSYVRIHLETLRASMSPLPAGMEPMSLAFSIADVSALVFHPTPSGATASAAPLLITDPHLHTQYSTSHPHFDSPTELGQAALPNFSVVDWTDPREQTTGSKLSHWRTKPAPQRRPERRGDAEASKAESLLALDLTLRRTTDKHRRVTTDVELTIVPLHFFVDLGHVAPLRDFLDELSSTRTAAVSRTAELSGDDDTPPATPQARKNTGQTVLDDLDADQDSRQAVTRVNVRTQMIRLEVRCPPPPSSPSARSGALVLDIHDIRVSADPGQGKRAIRFDPTDTSTMNLASFYSRRILVASSLAENPNVTAILSVGSLGSDQDALLPCITLSAMRKVDGPNATSLSFRIPSVFAQISKPQLDNLQYLIDDCSQLLERLAAAESIGGSESEDTSMIGSRFFTKSRNGSGSGSGLSSNSSEGPLVKVDITEAFVRILLPDPSHVERPFDIAASDIEVQAQSKPKGKDETVLTFIARSLDAKRTTSSGAVETILALTTPRGLTSSPQPLVKVTFTSLVVPGTAAKESRIRTTLWGFTLNMSPDIQWLVDFGAFAKPPPGAFESVVPTERTHISLKVQDGSIRMTAMRHPGVLVLHAGSLGFATTLVGGSPDVAFQLSLAELSVLMVDNLNDIVAPSAHKYTGARLWNACAVFCGIVRGSFSAESWICVVERDVTSGSQVCYNTIFDASGNSRTFSLNASVFVYIFAQTRSRPLPRSGQTWPKHLSLSRMRNPFRSQNPRRPLSRLPLNPRHSWAPSVDDLAFKRVPEVGPPPDMINDDLPTNMDYLDDSFGAAAGLRELRDEDLDDFDVDDAPIDATNSPGLVSKVGGETIKMLRPEGLKIVEHHFNTLPPETTDVASKLGFATVRVRVHKADINLLLYDGYDWARTRRTIEEEVKQMRRRLAKIRQLVAGGQTQDPALEEETGALLFNSVYIGLDQDVDELEPAALIAAIDEELRDDLETASQSSWQSLRPTAGAPPRSRSTKVHGKRLSRAKAPSIEFQFMGLEAEVDQYLPDGPVASRSFATIKDLEILDRMGTSTWNKFLSELRSDSRGNIRETESNMVRVELRSVRPIPGLPAEEARLRAKILPLRLYVDQDALDFLKKFFSFKDPHAAPPKEPDPSGEIYFQLAEIFPVDLKLDYKPRRVDYRALREGKTIELMNFFHFDEAEMTLRHITLSGVTGWPRLFDLLNDIWTPDVKATQLVDVISGVAPIRSVVNVGSGVADLVLLPIAQYKKDGRIVRGIQKGTTAFFKSTAVEAIKLGARLATGTQVILEQAEDVLGGQFKDPVTTETVQPIAADYVLDGQSDDESSEDDVISKYAQQPADLREGVQSAYKSLHRNLHSAAQTILAVPMEVYERSGNEGPVRSVIRAVPIAVLKPMIGVSEAVSKTMLGLHNALDPNVRHENEAKYKHRG